MNTRFVNTIQAAFQGDGRARVEVHPVPFHDQFEVLILLSNGRWLALTYSGADIAKGVFYWVAVLNTIERTVQDAFPPAVGGVSE
jgi:hypothetical protein